MNHLLSVVIPVHNRESQILPSVRSVLEQKTTYNIEVIVVDDMSSDGTVEVVRRASSTDPRIRLIRLHQNSGACAARNAGVEASTGSFVAFQDSDDLWLPGKIQRQLELLERSPEVGSVCCGLIRQSGRGVEVIAASRNEPMLLDANALLPRNICSTQTLLMRRQIAIAEPFSTDQPRFQDWELSMRLLKHGLLLDSFVGVFAPVGSDSISKNQRNAPRGRVGVARSAAPILGSASRRRRLQFFLESSIVASVFGDEQDREKLIQEAERAGAGTASMSRSVMAVASLHPRVRGLLSGVLESR